LLKNLFISICFGIAASSGFAGHTQVGLILANEMVVPGDTVLAGIELHMDPQWHTFWKNAGRSGIPTSIKWDLSWTVTAGDIQWPVPEKFSTNDLTTYGYKNDVILLVPLKVAYGVPQGPLDLKATVSWLEFKEQGIADSAEVHATLSIGRENRPSANAKLLHSWQAKLPQSGAALSAHAWWEGVSTSGVRQVILEWISPRAASAADFFPYESQSFEVQGATERIPAEDGKIRLRKQIKKFNGDWPGQVSGLLIEKTAEKQRGFEVTLPILEAPK
jgi:DsbC/DsbD-like thiol-disulfide interchange protein